ncbi:hypothetical protein V1477_021021, partial [Vespula maculifrons]
SICYASLIVALDDLISLHTDSIASSTRISDKPRIDEKRRYCIAQTPPLQHPDHSRDLPSVPKVHTLQVERRDKNLYSCVYLAGKIIQFAFTLMMILEVLKR